MSVDRGFLGRRWRCVAGGNSMSNAGPESHVPPAASGGGGAAEASERSREMNSRSLGPAGADAGEGRA